ncbi:unnamed protein product [Peniophora sp. CBMAI 1063]|nr:unnamed protein product [Peniophora sp. CBMAI 1063]
MDAYPSPFSIITLVCSFACAHPLFLYDCFASIILRGLHLVFPKVPVTTLIRNYRRLFAIGAYAPYISSTAISPGTRLDLSPAPIIKIQVEVSEELTHDTLYAIYICAIVSLSCGPTQFSFPRRLFLLKTPYDGHSDEKPCTFKRCFPHALFTSADTLVLAALRHRLTGASPADLPVNPTHTRAITAALDETLDNYTPPQQYVSEFAEVPNARIVPKDEPTGWPPVYPRVLDTNRRNPCAFVSTHLTCACLHRKGNSVIMDEAFLQDLVAYEASLSR